MSMKGCPYAKEPFDTKLFVLLFIKKLWIIAVAMLLGAVCIGGGYYVKKVVLGGPAEYEITTTYYVQYNNYDPITGEMHNYTNNVTWQTWVTSDYFVDRTWEYALEAGMQPEKYGVEKADLKNYFTADLPSDLRIPTSTVKTPYEELTKSLNKALQKMYQEFGKERVEMDSIIITDETPLHVSDKDIRTLRAVILGAVIGGFVAVLFVCFRILWDDSIFIPESFTYRYGVPMAGFMGKKQKELSKEADMNLTYLLGKDTQTIGFFVGKEPDKEIQGCLQNAGITMLYGYETVSGEEYKNMREAQKLILLVEAGSQNGKQIEHVLQELQLQNCPVTAAFLYHADAMLIGVYRMGRKG